MIIRLFIAILVIVALSYAFNQFRRQPKAKRKKLSLKFALYLLGGVILLLIATGRVHWITAVFAGIIPFMSRLIPLAIRIMPFLSQVQKQRMAGRMAWGNTSTMQTRFLKLELDQDSGTIRGEILSGLFAGKTLAQLSHSEAQQLLDYYQTHDRESQNLLFAYLQHRQQGDSFQRSGGAESASRNGGMSRSEALEVLGLEEGASQADIVAAHKKLMQRLHPDRGGSNYLAVKVNQAKTLLSQKRRA